MITLDSIDITDFPILDGDVEVCSHDDSRGWIEMFGEE
jgi:hypothetical protein